MTNEQIKLLLRLALRDWEVCPPDELAGPVPWSGMHRWAHRGLTVATFEPGCLSLWFTPTLTLISAPTLEEADRLLRDIIGAFAALRSNA